jgi:hypothetical protein
MDKLIATTQAPPVVDEAINEFLTPAPIYTGSRPGPWFPSSFPGMCEGCGGGFEQGDTVRADGAGGYECQAVCETEQDPACCSPCEGDETSEQGEPSYSTDHADVIASQSWERPTAANVKLPPIDVKDEFAQFLTSAPAVVHQRGPNKTDRNGHRVKDPVLGDFRRFKNGNIKSVRRVTTFNKAVSDTENLTGWMKRNVLLGAAARPEVVAMAHGKNHEDHKEFLNSLVKTLEEEAGSKKAADTGTLVHKLTEEFDAGRATMDDIPPAYRPMITWYRDALAAAGLRVVPGMQELTTFIEEWDGVSGSFDKIYEHIATGLWYIGDVKTGKTMDWGWGEIECQESIYAKGYNRHGVYDWDTETWGHVGTKPVSETIGIVIHLPVKGDHFGTCRVLAADLERGWDYAALCGAVRRMRDIKPKPVLWSDHVGVQAPPAPDWEQRFAVVGSPEDANLLWREAKAAGVGPDELKRLVAVAKDRLSSVSHVDTAGQAG